MNDPITILIVDDDPGILVVLDARLSAADFHVLKAVDAPSAIEILKKESIALMISDMKMPGMNGMDLLSEIRGIQPALPVIFLTAYGTIPDAVAALKQGAVDYITKPFDGRELICKIKDILSMDTPAGGSGADNVTKGFFWGNTPAMKELRQTVAKVAASSVNVLITGESGVGKECIARFIHQYGSRKDQPYVVVDCGSTPAGILESELFGHMKGAFTHAVHDKEGLIEAAHKGTLLLDEIGNISQDMQARLLRFLEDGKIRRVGAVKEIQVDCRILSATNADLPEDIEKGSFRKDLYYRLKGVTLNIPSLRERQADIPQLAAFFVNNYTREHGMATVHITDKTLDLLVNYPWPGNIRELKNALEAGIILCKNNRMEPSDLQLENIKTPSDSESMEDAGFSIDDSEKNTIIRALKKAHGVQKDAAELLKISKRTIHYKIKKFNLQPSDYK